MRLHRVPAFRRERVDRHRDRLRVRRVHHGDRTGRAEAGQPPCHPRVLRLDRLDDQPGQPGPGQLGQQVPYRLRFAGAGRSGHQRVPVEGRQRQQELAGRPVLRVEDRPEADRRAGSSRGTGRGPRLDRPCFARPGRGCPGRAGSGLAGHVELAGVEYPQPRYLPLGQPGERSQHTRGGQERRLGIAALRIHALRRQGGGERPRLQARAEPVGMVAQVGRPGEHGRQPGKLAGGRGPDEHPHRPQARLAERVQLRKPAFCLVGTGPEPFLLMLAQHRHLGAQPGLLGVEQAGGLGHHEPAEGRGRGPRPARTRTGPAARFPGRPTGAGSPSSGSAWRPGQSAQTSAPHVVSQPAAAGTPRAPGGKSKAQPLPACGPGRAALVMNSSGAPPARHSQPATNGRPARAAADAAGRMSRKSCSAERAARRATMDRTRYQGPANSSPRTGTGITTCAYQPGTAAATDTGSLPGNYYAGARTGRAAARPRWRARALAASWTAMRSVRVTHPCRTCRRQGVRRAPPWGRSFMRRGAATPGIRPSEIASAQDVHPGRASSW